MSGVKYPLLIAVRKLYSVLINHFQSKLNLPQVKSISDIQFILKQVKYKSDLFDWIQDAEVTWFKKTGDCEDYAFLAQVLLRQLDIQSYVLNIIISPSKYSHAVCVFPQGYFSNSTLITGSFTDEQIAGIIAGNNKLIWYGV